MRNSLPGDCDSGPCTTAQPARATSGTFPCRPLPRALVTLFLGPAPEPRPPGPGLDPAARPGAAAAGPPTRPGHERQPHRRGEDYRLHVVKQLPWLEVLDRHKVRRRLGLGLGQATALAGGARQAQGSSTVRARVGVRATSHHFLAARHEWFLLTVDAPCLLRH